MAAAAKSADTRRLVDLAEAGRLLGGISIRTVYRRIDAGELVMVKVGARTMVTLESLDRYVRRSSTKRTG